MLPFSREHFLSVFVAYNATIWRIEIVAVGLGVAIVVAMMRPFALSHRLIWLAVAAMWLWTGMVYHLVFFAPINKAAYGFGAASALQALLIMVYAFVTAAPVPPSRPHRRNCLDWRMWSIP